MSRPASLGVGGLILLLVALLAAVLGSNRSTDATPAQPLPDVRVRHSYVTVMPPAVTAMPAAVKTDRAPVRVAAAPPSRRPDPVQLATTRQVGMVAKARRALVGDGRYRPEPFPRIREH